EESVLAALVALGRLAHDLGDEIESIDINPFVALPAGQGALALDALIVLRLYDGQRRYCRAVRVGKIAMRCLCMRKLLPAILPIIHGPGLAFRLTTGEG